MERLLGGSASPVGWVVSYLQASLGDTTAVLTHGKVKRRTGFSKVPDFPDCLQLLEPLAVPATRELLIACHGGWTAIVSNDALGGDPTAPAPYLARELDVRCVIASHSPRYGPGHSGSQFWVHGPDGEPPLMYERTIDAVAEDGRWRWHTSGPPLAFEDLRHYEERQIKNRLNREIVVAYLGELGILADDDAFYGETLVVDRPKLPGGITRSRTEALAWLDVKD